MSLMYNFYLNIFPIQIKIMNIIGQKYYFHFIEIRSYDHIPWAKKEKLIEIREDSNLKTEFNGTELTEF